MLVKDKVVRVHKCIVFRIAKQYKFRDLPHQKHLVSISELDSMMLVVLFQLEIFCDSVFHIKGTTYIMYGLTHHKNAETFPFKAIRKDMEKNYCVTPLMKGMGEGISSCIPGGYTEITIRIYHKPYSNTCTKTFYYECNEDIIFFFNLRCLYKQTHTGWVTISLQGTTVAGHPSAPTLC